MNRCESCFRRHWRAKINKATGLQIKHNNGNLVYVCIWCGHVQEEDCQIIPIPQRIKANILYLDIETSKDLYYNYGARVPSKYLRAENLVHEWYMMGWAASYVGNDKVWSQFVTPQAAKEWDDGEIVQRLWDLMNATEIIAGHNVDGFDLKKINTCFKKHKLPAITGKTTIDTLKICRSKYSFNHNDLGSVAERFGLNGKDDITNQDWINAMNGHKKTIDKIHKYCVGDVTSGKGVLMELLPIANKRYDFGSKKARPDTPDMLRKLMEK